MTTRGGTLAALLAALGRPSWWILALAGFLVRGGIVLFLVAIVALPSPLALANLLGPLITPLALGNFTPAAAAVLLLGVGAVVAWLIAGTWFAAATEVVLVRDAHRAASEEGLTVRPAAAQGRLLITRVAVAHLLALVPMVAVIAIGSVQISAVAYRELVNPSDGSSILLRVLGGASGPIAAIVIAWVLGELVGGMAVRRIVLGGEPLAAATVRSTLDLVRRPGGALIVPLATVIVLVADLAAMLAVVSLVWTEVRSTLVHPLQEPLVTGLTLLTLGAAWCLALLVTGLIDAWRSAAMTFEAVQIEARSAAESSAPTDRESHSGSSTGGTIGAPPPRRPGDWSANDRGGSL